MTPEDVSFGLDASLRLLVPSETDRRRAEQQRWGCIADGLRRLDEAKQGEQR